MKNQSFVIFSNTVEEYEAFIKSGVFYWPNGISKLTKFQNKLEDLNLEEKVGDKVLIVAGAKIRGIKDPYLNEKIVESPMLTHVAEVVEVKERPVLGYRYTHGRNPGNSFMFPFDFLPQFKTLPSYLGKEFSKDNLEEIDQAIALGESIQQLLSNDEIVFTRAFVKDDLIYLQGESEDRVYEIAPGFPSHLKKDKSITDKLTYREMPDKESLIKIINACKERGLDGEKLILSLRTWRGKKYMKLNIVEEKFQVLSGKLQEGISTRLLLNDDSSDDLLNQIKNALAVNETENLKSEGSKMSVSKNTILYGPPGTGKTYSVIEKAVNIIEPSFSNTNPSRKQYEDKYRKYLETKQIHFCTFHQSFSYEDFVEGLRSDIEKEGTPFTPQNGVFKEICELAKSRYQVSNAGANNLDQIGIFKISLGEANSSEGENIYRYCIENKKIALGHGKNIDFTNKNTINEIENAFKTSGANPSNHVIGMVNHFKNELKVGDLVIVTKGKLKFRAIAKVTGEYYYDEETQIPYHHFRDVEWLYISTNNEEAASILNHEKTDAKSFSIPSIYPFNKENLNLDAIDQLLASHHYGKEERFVLIIDEINRGNISKIFGELITLIEEDKRFDIEEDGTVKGLKVTLPYSKKPFYVPQNVYILGTMNTADRSISLMDTALRRRFDFEELLPNPSILKEVDGVEVNKLLEKMNKRIEYLYDRDHQIGHAFFIGKENEDELIEVMQRKVIPLLQEYFYDDWEKIELVLGGAGKSADDKDYFIYKEEIKATDLFASRPKIQPKRVTYSVVKEPTKQALLNIYQEKVDESDE